MQVSKLRVATDETGLVPAGEYFKRLASALREANEKAGRFEQPRQRAHRRTQASVATR